MILDAARRVFERNGYLAANVEDIVKEAGVARGSFYTYFQSKRDLFRVLFDESCAAIDEVVARHSSVRLDPVAALQESNRRFVAYYRANAAMQRLVEQADVIDDELRLARFRLRQRQVERVTASITRWQQEGVANPDIDAASSAAALVSMTVNFCYWSFVARENSHAEAQGLETLNHIWIRALDLKRRASPRRLLMNGAVTGARNSSVRKR